MFRRECTVGVRMQRKIVLPYDAIRFAAAPLDGGCAARISPRIGALRWTRCGRMLRVQACRRRGLPFTRTGDACKAVFGDAEERK